MTRDLPARPEAEGEVLTHYRGVWGEPLLVHPPLGGRAAELPAGFAVLEFAWGALRVFATVGAAPGAGEGLEIFLLAHDEATRHADILICVAHYHLTGAALGLHHVVNLGEPWRPGSRCTHAYLSLPYLFGPRLEWLVTERRRTRCLWLVPITGAERRLMLSGGAEALEQALERAQVDLADPMRGSISRLGWLKPRKRDSGERGLGKHVE